MDDHKVILRMVPVCECGYVFREGIIIQEHVEEVAGIKYARYSIDPHECPACHKEIEGIEVKKY